MTWFKDYNWEGYVERPIGDSFEKAAGACSWKLLKVMSL